MSIDSPLTPKRIPSTMRIRDERKLEIHRVFTLYDAELPVVNAHSVLNKSFVLRIKAQFPGGHPGTERLDHLSRIFTNIFGRDTLIEFAPYSVPMEPGWEPL